MCFGSDHKTPPKTPGWPWHLILVIFNMKQVFRFFFLQRTNKFCKELKKLLPNTTLLYRRGLDLKKVIPQAVSKEYTYLIVVNEDRRIPSILCESLQDVLYRMPINMQSLSSFLCGGNFNATCKSGPCGFWLLRKICKNTSKSDFWGTCIAIIDLQKNEEKSAISNYHHFGCFSVLISE